MRAALWIAIAMALLSDMMAPAMGAQGPAPKSGGMQTEAPASNNPLDDVINRLYWLETTEQITAEQSQEEFGKALKKATPEQIRQFWEDTERMQREQDKKRK